MKNIDCDANTFENRKLQENPEKVSEYLEDIRNWLSENPSVNACPSTTNLLYFLRACKYDLERTKNKIKSYYLMRAERPEWFSNRNPFLPEIQELLNLGVFLPLPEKDEHNRHVVIIRTSAHNPKIHLQNDVFKVSKMILDLLLKLEEDISIHGLVAIFDMNGVTLGHALQLTPSLIKRSVESWQVYPCRTKLLEFINAPRHVNIMLNTFRLFMSSKMRSRLVVRSSTSEIKVNLPTDLGGTGKSYAELATYWKHVTEENSSFFSEDEQYKSIISNNA